MKKRLFLTITLFFAPAIILAAQTPVTQIEKFNSAATKIDDMRVATNVRLAAAQSNFTEIYTALNGAPWLAQTTAPSIYNVFWIDTSGASPAIKYWDGDSWEVAAAGGDGTYTLPSASAETKGGVKIGARLTMTGDVLSADVQTTDISGKQDTLVSGTNIKTINGASILGLGDIVIDGGSISLATEQNWTAVQNFNAGLTAIGLTQDLNSWGDWTFAGTQIVNASGTGVNELWPASKVISELAGKENAAGNPAVNGYCWQSTTTGARSWGPCGAGGSFTFDTFPIYSDSPHSSGIAVNDTHVAVYSGETNGWGVAALTFSLSPSPITYSLDLTISGALGLDKISVNGSDYSASAVIPGLSSATTAITASADTGRQAVCFGDNTGAYPNYLVDMSTSNKVVSCAFSTAPVASFYGAPGSIESFGSGAFDLSEFTEVDPNNKIALDTTYAHTGSYGTAFTPGAGFGTEYIRANLGQLEDSYTIEWWIKSPAPSGDYTVRYFYAASSSTTPTTTTSQTIAIGWRGNGSGAQHLYMAPTVGGTAVNSTILAASTEYRFSLAVTRNAASVLSVYDATGTLVTSLTVTAPDRQSQYFYWSAYPGYSIDDVKFNSTNP